MSNQNNTTAIIILMEDALLHTDEQPLCNDTSCPCHERECDRCFLPTLEYILRDGNVVCLKCKGELEAAAWEAWFAATSEGFDEHPFL